MYNIGIKASYICIWGIAVVCIIATIYNNKQLIVNKTTPKNSVISEQNEQFNFYTKNMLLSSYHNYVVTKSFPVIKSKTVEVVTPIKQKTKVTVITNQKVKPTTSKQNSFDIKQVPL